jgi:hypothetical protein
MIVGECRGFDWCTWPRAEIWVLPVVRSVMGGVTETIAIPDAVLLV